MRAVLEELFYGNVCPSSHYSSSEQAKELMVYIVDHYDNLKETLTEKQREELENMKTPILN